MSRTLPAVLLDVDVAEVVDYLNRQGLPTLSSCQGDPGVEPGKPDAVEGRTCGYLTFSDSITLDKAMRILAELASASDRDRLAMRVLSRPWADIEGRRVILASGEPWRYELHRLGNRPGAGLASAPVTATVRCRYEDLLTLSALVRAGTTPV